MPKFNPGDLIKKIRGEINVGVTALVVDLPISIPGTIYGCDTVIQLLCPAKSLLEIASPGEIVDIQSAEWEKIEPPADRETNETEKELLLENA